MEHAVAIVGRMKKNAGLSLTRGDTEQLEMAMSVELARVRKQAAELERSQCAAIAGNKAMLFIGDPVASRALRAVEESIRARGK